MSSNGLNGIHVPRWLIGAVLATIAVFGAGYAAGQKLDARIDARIADVTNARLCRIEAALKLPPWPSCRP